MNLLKTKTRATIYVSALVLTTLAGCESGARQDPFPRPNSVNAVQMPAVSSMHMYHESTKTQTSTPVAYEEPPTMSFVDRPLLENMAGSLELADYMRAMRQTGLLPLLGRNGPYTVFAIPNEPFERYAAQVPGGLMAGQNMALLKQILAYTIVPGNWSPSAIDKAMRKAKADRIGLKTLSGDVLTIQRNPADNHFVLLNSTGRSVKLWLNGAPQSNGTLYFTQDILLPRD